MGADLVDALRPVIEALERIHVPYEIGGSVASSVHGTPRATMDVDLVADLHREQLAAFLTALGDDYYASREMMVEALDEGRPFNLIHRPTMIKVDVFPLGQRRYDRVSFERDQMIVLAEAPDELRVRVATAEDVVLRKLEWSRRGDEVSEVQWRDVLGVLRVQGEAIDRDYLRRWASEIGVLDLLDRALEEVERVGE